MSLTVLYWVLLLVMLVGVVGAILPAVPGPSLILIAAVVWWIATGFSGFGLPTVVVIVLLVLSLGVELLAAYLGAKRFGASRWGVIGAIVGLVLGIVGLLPALPFGGPIVGLFFGPVAGAFIGEFLFRRTLELSERIWQSLRACVGIVVGTVIGKLMEFFLAIAAFVIFIIDTWPQVAP